MWYKAKDSIAAALQVELCGATGAGCVVTSYFKRKCAEECEMLQPYV